MLFDGYTSSILRCPFAIEGMSAQRIWSERLLRSFAFIPWILLPEAPDYAGRSVRTVRRTAAGCRAAQLPK